jgi:mono/diheme cytochrome c family protein
MNVCEGRKDSKAPLEDRRRPGRPVRREARGDEPRLRRRPCMDRLGLRAVGEILEDAASEAAGDAERLSDRRTVEPAKPRCRRGRTKDAANRGRMEAAAMEHCGGCHADAGDDLVAGDEREEEIGAGRAHRLGGRDRRGSHHRAHVTHGIAVGVVEVEPVTQHAVGERRVRSRASLGDADHRGIGPASALAHRLAPGRGDPECMRREPATERVEEVQLGGGDDFGGDRRQTKPGCPGGEALGGSHG